MLRNAGFERTYFKKNNPMVTMSFMHNAHLKRREYMVTFNREKNKFIDHSARIYVNFFSLFNSIISHSEMIELNRSAMRGSSMLNCVVGHLKDMPL